MINCPAVFPKHFDVGDGTIHAQTKAKPLERHIQVGMRVQRWIMILKFILLSEFDLVAKGGNKASYFWNGLHPHY
jgi:hypothetical protein